MIPYDKCIRSLDNDAPYKLTYTLLPPILVLLPVWFHFRYLLNFFPNFLSLRQISLAAVSLNLDVDVGRTILWHSVVVVRPWQPVILGIGLRNLLVRRLDRSRQVAPQQPASLSRHTTDHVGGSALLLISIVIHVRVVAAHAQSHIHNRKQ